MRKRLAYSSSIHRSESLGNLAKSKALVPRANGNAVTQQQTRTSEQNTTNIESQYIRNLQQQIYFLELENSYLKNRYKKGPQEPQQLPPPSHAHHNGAHQHSNGHPKILTETEGLVEKLRRSRLEKERMQSSLRRKDAEVDDVSRQQEMLIQQLQTLEEEHVRDRERLGEELVEVQKQLDDCRPELARKDAEIAEVQSELRDALDRINQLETANCSLDEELEQRRRGYAVREGLEEEQMREMENLVANIRRLEEELTEHKVRIKNVTDDLSEAKRAQREAELQLRKEKIITDKVTEENNNLIQENSQLTSQVSTYEKYIGEEGDRGGDKDYLHSEMAELKQKNQLIRLELIKIQEEYRTEQNKTTMLSSQLSTVHQSENDWKDSVQRLQAEISALEQQNRSLSSEIQDLRKERVSYDVKYDEIKKMLTQKETELNSVKEEVATLEQHHRRLLRHYQQESVLQDEKCREFESLAQRVKELSRSIRHTSLFPTTNLLSTTSNTQDNTVRDLPHP